MMKNRLTTFAARLLLPVLAATCLLTACRNTPKQAPQQPVAQAAAQSAGRDTTLQPSAEPVTQQDTTCCGWHVVLQTAANNTQIRGTNLRDSTLLVTISKNGKLLFDRKPITTRTVLGGEDDTRQLGPSFVSLITNTTVYIIAGAYVPDSDDGFASVFAFSRNGSLSVYPMPESYDYFDIATEFYIMYTHENLQRPVDRPSLQKVAREYGTEAFVRQLDKDGPLSIYPPIVAGKYHLDVDFSVYTETLEEAGNIREWANMYFYDKQQQRSVGSMRVELAGEKNEYNDIGYNKINRIYAP
ncbi:hypothetical protein [Prevotella sp. kh1p2]|uniref:hypothetical protein n=1 Tax=Prevotella sp. kh1p2 TaxID=1761883 RepID=UPI000B832AF3|nr:hypothetical protein [Prevotella sp. kh1p2]